MKITWFGGSALRVHIGGKFIVCDPETAARDVDPTELVSGADVIFKRNPGLPDADSMTWQPRRAAALIDESEPPDVLIHNIAPGSALIDAVGEPPLLILGAALLFAGRWKNDAVAVLFDGFTAISTVSTLRPRLVALAFDDFSLEPAVDTLRKDLAHTSLMVLERGMAIEI
jgi:hypothetical protein